MFIVTLLLGISKGYLLLIVLSESMAVLAFGVGLVGATAGLRWFLRRHDEKIEDKR